MMLISWEFFLVKFMLLGRWQQAEDWVLVTIRDTTTPFASTPSPSPTPPTPKNKPSENSENASTATANESKPLTPKSPSPRCTTSSKNSAKGNPLTTKTKPSTKKP